MALKINQLSPKQLEHIKKIANDPLIIDYHDRGMMKWQGMYLSEHTAAIKQSRFDEETTVFRHQPMATCDILQLLMTAYQKQRPVIVQRGAINLDGQQEDYLKGFVKGFDEDSVYINDRQILIEEIEFVKEG